MSTITKTSSFSAFESILQHTQKDDVVFLALIILSGVMYTLFIKDKPDPYHHIWFEKPQVADANAKGVDTRDIGTKLEESVSGRP
jgi:NADPH-ferrihemoprotein reductase